MRTRSIYQGSDDDTALDAGVEPFTADLCAYSKLAETEYLALLTALTAWMTSGHRPEPENIGARCQGLEAMAPVGCHFVPTHAP